MTNNETKIELNRKLYLDSDHSLHHNTSFDYLPYSGKASRVFHLLLSFSTKFSTKLSTNFRPSVTLPMRHREHDIAISPQCVFFCQSFAHSSVSSFHSHSISESLFSSSTTTTLRALYVVRDSVPFFCSNLPRVFSFFVSPCSMFCLTRRLVLVSHFQVAHTHSSSSFQLNSPHVFYFKTQKRFISVSKAFQKRFKGVSPPIQQQ